MDIVCFKNTRMNMLLVNRTQSLFGVVPGSGLHSTFVTLFTQQTLWYLIPESCSLLVRTYVPSFTRSRSFPEFSIAVRKDWVIEGLETVKELSRETHCPSLTARHKRALVPLLKPFVLFHGPSPSQLSLAPFSRSPEHSRIDCERLQYMSLCMASLYHLNTLSAKMLFYP